MPRGHAKALENWQVENDARQRRSVAQRQKKSQHRSSKPEKRNILLLRDGQANRSEHQGKQADVPSEFGLIGSTEIRQQTSFRHAAKDPRKDHRQCLLRRQRVGDKILEGISSAEALAEKFRRRNNLH